MAEGRVHAHGTMMQCALIWIACKRTTASDVQGELDHCVCVAMACGMLHVCLTPTLAMMAGPMQKLRYLPLIKMPSYMQLPWTLFVMATRNSQRSLLCCNPNPNLISLSELLTLTLTLTLPGICKLFHTANSDPAPKPDNGLILTRARKARN